MFTKTSPTRPAESNPQIRVDEFSGLDIRCRCRTNSSPRNPMPEPERIDRRARVEELPEFLSPEEFRLYVGLGRSTIYDLLRRDEIPHVRFGRVIRIPKSALQTGAGK